MSLKNAGVGARAGRAVSAEHPELREGTVAGAAALSLVAALIYLWAVPIQAWIWWGYGAFFVAVALFQGLLAVALLRWPKALLALAGISGNLAVIFSYVFTRTAGVPFGPHAGRVKEVGVLDMSAVLAEMGLVVLLVTLLPGAYRSATLNALLLLGAAMWALRLLGFFS